MIAALAALALTLAAGAPLRVGSKTFTESIVLGEIAAGVLADDGLPVEHRRALGGTRVVWEALLRGDVTKTREPQHH